MIALLLWLAAAGAAFGQVRPIVALGDSVTLGVRRSPRVTASQRFSNLIGARLGRTVINAGVGGDTTRELLARLDGDVLNRKPRAVMVMVGLNDASWVEAAAGGGYVDRDAPRVPLAEFEANLTQIARRIQSTGAKLVLLTPNPMTRRYRYQRARFYQDNDINDGVAPYAEAVRRVSRLSGACTVDVFGAWVYRRAHTRWIPDGLHPNAAGHRLIADLVLARCRPALR
ncbi:MAG: GDSL-type esterase/lipase family protein [Bryobacteraceae bacterium]